MPIRGAKEKDYKPLSTAHKPGRTPPSGLKPLVPATSNTAMPGEPQNPVNHNHSDPNETDARDAAVNGEPAIRPSTSAHADVAAAAEISQPASPAGPKTEKKARKDEKDRLLLGR